MGYPAAPRTEIRAGGVWVDITDRLTGDPITRRVGRQDEAARTSPTDLKLRWHNDDGHLTPGHPVSPWWPDVDLSMQVRQWVHGNTPALVLPNEDGAYASTPDHPSLDIAGTLAIVAWLHPNIWALADGVVQRFVNKWQVVGDERSFMFSSLGAGQLVFDWTTDGTAGTQQARFCPRVIATLKPTWVAMVFEPDNGASGHTITWLTSDDGVTFDELASDTQPGVTSIHAGTAPLEIGSVNDGAASYAGRALAVQLIDGDLDTGTDVANPDFTAQTPGTSGFTDAAGRPWTLHGAAEITTRRLRFVGQAVDLDPHWPEGDISQVASSGLARVDATIAGPLRRLSQGASALHSTLYRLVTSPSVAANIDAYWPCEDGRDTIHAGSPIPGVPPLLVVGARFASDSDFDASGPQPSIPAGQPFGWNGTVPPPPPGTTQQRFDYFWQVDTPDASPADVLLIHLGTTGSARQWRVRLNDTQVSFSARDSEGGALMLGSFGVDPTFFGNRVLLSVDLVQNGADIDWTISLVPIPFGVSWGVNGTITNQTFGRIANVANLESAAPPDGMTIGQFIVSHGLNLGWLSGADTAWVGETAAHRFWRLCREEQVPYQVIGDPNLVAEFRGDPTYSARMGPQRALALPQLLQECVDVDHGLLHEHPTAAGVVMRTRRSLYNQAAALTIDAQQRHLGFDFRPRRNDQRIRNEYEVTRPNGSSAVATTDPPPAVGDRYDDSVTINAQDDLQLPEHAQWLVHLGTWREMRYQGLPVDLIVSPDLIDGWLDLTQGDRVDVTGLPPEHPTASIAQLAEGASDTLAPEQWTGTVTTSPAGPYEVGVRDDPAAKRDTAGSVLDAAYVAGTDTTIDVETTQGPLWTTDAGEMPIELSVGGVHVEATAIGAAVGQVQTFTITQTPLNGITRTVPAGAPVRLWRPTIRAL